MKKLNLFALILVAAGGLALIYNYFAVQPNLFEPDPESPTYMSFDWETHSHYRHMSDYMGLAGSCLGGIGFILGLVAYFKGKEKSGIIWALLGAVVCIMSIMVSFAHVM